MITPQPGDVAMVTALNDKTPWMAGYNGRTWVGLTGVLSVDVPITRRPLLVVDPEDAAQVEQLCKAFVAAGVWQVIPAEVESTHAHRAAQVAAALLAVACPKVYREHTKAAEPWPLVAECFSSQIEGHECPQCAWVHEHDWVAWVREPGVVQPIRCSKCGGRKCDRDDCAEQRHGHTHWDEVPDA